MAVNALNTMNRVPALYRTEHHYEIAEEFHRHLIIFHTWMDQAQMVCGCPRSIDIDNWEN